jgi:hypothetical protein
VHEVPSAGNDRLSSRLNDDQWSVIPVKGMTKQQEALDRPEGGACQIHAVYIPWGPEWSSVRICAFYRGRMRIRM